MFSPTSSSATWASLPTLSMASVPLRAASRILEKQRAWAITLGIAVDRPELRREIRHRIHRYGDLLDPSIHGETGDYARIVRDALWAIDRAEGGHPVLEADLGWNDGHSGLATRPSLRLDPAGLSSSNRYLGFAALSIVSASPREAFFPDRDAAVESQRIH